MIIWLSIHSGIFVRIVYNRHWYGEKYNDRYNYQ